MGFRITGRREQHGVDQAEDGRVRANAKCEHQNRDDGETRRFDQLSTGESEIMNHNFRWDERRPRVGFNNFYFPRAIPSEV